MSVRGLTTALLAIVLLVGGAWIGNQGSLEPVQVGAFAASVQAIVKALPVLMVIWLACAGFGGALRRVLKVDVSGGWVLSLSLGLAVWLALSWLLAWAGWLTPATGWVVTGVGGLLALWRLSDPKRRESLYPDNWPSPPWTLLMGLPVLGMFAIATTMPPGTLWRVEAYGYDVMLYHLQLPKEWLSVGAMRGLTHNVYSYLPNLVEAGYMQLAVLQGGVTGEAHVRTFQMFHACCALLTAAGIGQVVSVRAGRTAGVFAGVVFLATPWVFITGSLAYNEMVVTALAGAGLLVLLDSHELTGRRALVVGLLAGASAMAKLPAAAMVALPLGVVLVWRVVADARGAGKGQREGAKHAARLAGMMAVGALLLVGPYLVRNAVWTGNPVFPFAAELLGSGHWDASNVARWEAAHSADVGLTGRMVLLGRQWLFNGGYGSVGGFVHEGRELARFELEWGIPLLWGAVVLAAVLALRWREQRKVAFMLLVMLGIQALFWLMGTHLQSRFLVPTLVPGCVLLGIGGGRLEQLTQSRFRYAFPLLAGVVPVLMSLTCYILLMSQTRPLVDLDSNRLVSAAPWRYVDNIVEFCTPSLNNPIHSVSKVYMVADAQFLLYIDRPVSYRTPFDTSLIGQIIREQGEFDPEAIRQALVARGFSHIWFGWSELYRFTRAGNYGYDPDVTLQRMAALYRHLEGEDPSPRALQSLVSLRR